VAGSYLSDGPSVATTFLPAAPESMLVKF
jgi:hypothetical protein